MLYKTTRAKIVALFAFSIPQFSISVQEAFSIANLSAANVCTVMSQGKGKRPENIRMRFFRAGLSRRRYACVLNKIQALELADAEF